MQLYEAVIRHRAEGRSYNEIIGAIEEEFHVRLSKSHVSNWTRGKNVPDGSVKVVPFPTASLSYVIGVMLGDGSMSVCGDHNYKLKLRVTDKDFAEAFADAVGIVLNRIGPRVKFHAKTNAWHVEVSSLFLQQFLRWPSKSSGRPSSTATSVRGAFLRSFFDSEGNVCEGSISASNTDKALIQFVLSQLLRLGIQVTGPYLHTRGDRPVIIKSKTYRANHDCLWIRIRNVPRSDFLHKAGFKIKRKNDSLTEALDALEGRRRRPSKLIGVD
jgi:hypothetical protein